MACEIEIQLLKYMEIKSMRFFMALAICALSLSCEKAGEETAVQPLATGTYILNNGSWGENDADVGVYDPLSRTFSQDVFCSANSFDLGDLGQDIISFGENVFIAVGGSRTIFVTDHQLKVKAQINTEKNGARLSPRAFATDGTYVYVTYYEGYVGKIDPENHSVMLAQVGPNPEGLAIAAGNLYVADSGGMAYPSYNNSLSVVSLERFELVGTVTVNTNPAKVEASSDGAFVYVFSYGDYASVPSKIQVLETASGRIADLPYASVTSIAKGKNDVMYILCGGYDSDWNPLPGTVWRHDMAAGKELGSFVTDGTLLPSAFSISAPSDGYIYVGCSDYVTTGDVYVFTPDGRLHDHFDSQGMNPIKAY